MAEQEQTCESSPNIARKHRHAFHPAPNHCNSSPQSSNTYDSPVPSPPPPVLQEVASLARCDASATATRTTCLVVVVMAVVSQAGFAMAEEAVVEPAQSG